MFNKNLNIIFVFKFEYNKRKIVKLENWLKKGKLGWGG